MPIPEPFVPKENNILENISKFQDMDYKRTMMQRANEDAEYNAKARPLALEKAQSDIEYEKEARPIMLEHARTQAKSGELANSIAAITRKHALINEAGNAYDYVTEGFTTDPTNAEGWNRYRKVKEYTIANNPESASYFVDDKLLTNGDGSINKEAFDKQHKFIDKMIKLIPVDSKDYDDLTIYNEKTRQMARIPVKKGTTFNLGKELGADWKFGSLPAVKDDKEDKIKPVSTTTAVDLKLIKDKVASGDSSYVQTYYESAPNDSTMYYKPKKVRRGLTIGGFGPTWESDRASDLANPDHVEAQLPKINGKQVTMADVRASVLAGRGSYQQVIDALNAKAGVK